MAKPVDFGLMLAINGVLLSGGNRPLPHAKAAIAKLIDGRGNFRVPTVFVTNMTRFGQQAVAHKLMLALGVKIDPDQVVMGHSPLRLFHQYHRQHVFVCGAGNTREMMNQLGFQKVSNADQLRETFRSVHKPSVEDILVNDYGTRTSPSKHFGPIESIVLLNEPEKWESNLQLIIDLLYSDGFRRQRLRLRTPSSSKPHIPIIACGVDLLKAGSFDTISSVDVTLESGPPRIGHGAFLIALEHLFEKLSGSKLNYAALVGKPSPITYVFAERLLRQQARRLNSSLRRIYAIGDNPHADVYGANLFNRLLSLRKTDGSVSSEKTSSSSSDDEQLLSNVVAHSGMNLLLMLDDEGLTQEAGASSVLESNASMAASPSFVTASSSVHRARNEADATVRLQSSGVATSRHVFGTSGNRDRGSDLVLSSPPAAKSTLESCVSVLVQTGVTSEMGAATATRFAALDHFHRDLPRFRDCATPSHVCANVFEAVRTVYDAEKYHPEASS